MTLRQIKHIHTQHPNPRTIIMLNVRFILPLRLSTILEIKNEFNQLTDQLKYFLLILIIEIQEDISLQKDLCQGDC